MSLTLRDFRKATPIDVRWNALDGAVLASLTHSGDGVPFTGKFNVPEAAKPGNYVVVFSQAASGQLTQAPVRAVMTVVAPGGANPVLGADRTPVDTDRPSGLVTTDNSVSGGTLLLMGLGVAGIGMFLVGTAAVVAGRQGASPAVARATSRS